MDPPLTVAEVWNNGIPKIPLTRCVSRIMRGEKNETLQNLGNLSLNNSEVSSAICN
jgi:hypothetical protein